MKKETSVYFCKMLRDKSDIVRKLKETDKGYKVNLGKGAKGRRGEAVLLQGKTGTYCVAAFLLLDSSAQAKKAWPQWSSHPSCHLMLKSLTSTVF